MSVLRKIVRNTPGLRQLAKSDLVQGIYKRYQISSNIRNAFAKTGINYVPAKGSLPIIIGRPDIWFRAIFPEGQAMEIHLTEERGFQDIDGMAHIRWYRQFAQQIFPSVVNGAAGPDSPVLDCACGSGYGSSYLNSTLARQVIGVDIDEAAISYATLRYKANHLSYVQANAMDLSFLNQNSVSAIVSVEMIEHVPEPDRALSEFARVLSPGGALLITTPDATDRPGTVVSAFHLREYTAGEFAALLENHFGKVTLEAPDNASVLVAVCRNPRKRDLPAEQ